MSLLEAGFADEFLLHLAPRILGDNEAAPLFDGRSPLTMAEALEPVSYTHLAAHAAAPTT